MKNLITKLEQVTSPSEKVDLAIAVFEAMDDVNDYEFKGEKTRKYIFFTDIFDDLYHNDSAYRESIRLFEYYQPIMNEVEYSEDDDLFQIFDDVGKTKQEIYDYVLASYLELEELEKAYKIYSENYEDVFEYFTGEQLFDYENIFEIYTKIQKCKEELKPNSPKNAQIYFEMAKAYDDASVLTEYEVRKALEYIDKSLEIDPTNEEVKELKIQWENWYSNII